MNTSNFVECVKVDFILTCFKSLESEVILNSEIHLC